MNIEWDSNEIIADNLYLIDAKYNFIYSDGLSESSLFARTLNYGDYSLDSINFKYIDNLILLTSNNIDSGEFLNFKSTISESDIFINYFDARINSINIYGEKISIFNNGDNYRSRNMDISINSGKLHSDLIFKNSKNYSFDIFFQNINLDSIDKLMFLNDRYEGTLNGDVNFSMKESKLFGTSNLLVDNFKFDDLEYLSTLLKTSMTNSKIIVNQFSGQGKDASFEISGFVDLDDLKVHDYNNVFLEGNISNLDIFKLNRYTPWSIEIGGKLSSNISISGSLDNIKFEMNPTITSPKFDKIYGDKIFGKIKYKNNRLYLSNVICQTFDGKYDITGSLPANLNYFNKEMIHLKPIYVDINAKSKSMELLSPYFPFIKKIKGDFEYTLSIHGNYKKTIRDGEIIIKNAYLDILQIDNRINNINSYAVINNNRLIINGFEAELLQNIESEDFLNEITSSMKGVFNRSKVNEKNINISGSINLNSFFNPDLSINIVGKDNYMSSSYGQFEGFGNSKISVTGQDTILVSGIFEPRFNEFILFDIEDRRENNEVQNVAKSKFIAYDIYVPFSNGIRIKSDNIDLMLEGEANLSSFSNDDVAISGKANIVDGNFFYNGNEFYNTQGTILIDPVSVNPYVEIHSTTDIYEDNINVSFIGYTDNPSLILESSLSNYSQSDILQLLTFKDKNLDQSISQPFSNVITNYLESQLEKNVTLYTDLDEFRLQHSGSLIEGFGDADISVFMGKRISNRLYLNTKINLNDNNLNEYEMSYRLNSNTSIVAKIDDNKYWKLNYRFKYKY